MRGKSPSLVGDLFLEKIKSAQNFMKWRRLCYSQAHQSFDLCSSIGGRCKDTGSEDPHGACAALGWCRQNIVATINTDFSSSFFSSGYFSPRSVCYMVLKAPTNVHLCQIVLPVSAYIGGSKFVYHFCISIKRISVSKFQANI